MRTGLIGKKLGMTRVFTDEGQHVPVTVIDVSGCEVTAQRTADKDGYSAVQLGMGNVKPKRLNSAMRGHFRKNGVAAKQKLAEFRVSEDAMVNVGAKLSPAHFVTGQYVDVTGTSIGKGFAGAMKRHGFAGLRASHGVSVSHRSHGSTGQCQDPGKVFKGKKMAGHMGDARNTMHSLEVVKTVPEDGLIMIRGSVPGAKGSWVILADSKKKPLPGDLPLPAGLLEDAAEENAGADEAAEAEIKAEAKTEAKTEDKAGEKQAAGTQDAGKADDAKAEGGDDAADDKKKD